MLDSNTFDFLTVLPGEFENITEEIINQLKVLKVSNANASDDIDIEFIHDSQDDSLEVSISDFDVLAVLPGVSENITEEMASLVSFSKRSNANISDVVDNNIVHNPVSNMAMRSSYIVTKVP